MSQLAYLVIREGAKWSDVFRLVPGQAVTIGRAPTNQIVLKDERCSRNHVEVFISADQWTLRDLDSRNGTYVGNERLIGDRPLNPGDIIRIGHSQLIFVHRLAGAFADSSSVLRPLSDQTKLPISARRWTTTASVLRPGPGRGPTTITHRRGQTRFLEPGEEDATGISKIGRAAAKLCRMAFELAKAPDTASMADLALAGLAEGTQTDAGAVLVLPARFSRRAAAQTFWKSWPREVPPSGIIKTSPGAGGYRDARGRGGAGQKRDGRQHPGQPRQPRESSTRPA